MAAPDYYALLGVPRNATTAEVRKARAAHKRGDMSDSDYDAFLEAHMAN